MGLVLTLKPQERIILGGAVVRNNGAYSAQLMIETTRPDSPLPEHPARIGDQYSLRPDLYGH